MKSFGGRVARGANGVQLIYDEARLKSETSFFFFTFHLFWSWIMDHEETRGF